MPPVHLYALVRRTRGKSLSPFWKWCVLERIRGSGGRLRAVRARDDVRVYRKGSCHVVQGLWSLRHDAGILSKNGGHHVILR